MSAEKFRCYRVTKDAQNQVSSGLSECTLDELPPGEVVLQVRYSSLNYKDALGATGHPGVAKTLPHVPGIDAAGTVVRSDDSRFRPGQEVIATGYEIGTERWGAWSTYLRVPAEWVLPVPQGLSLEEAMILGTAGFTAAQSVDALQRHGVTPEKGEVVVTGATGGVGSLAVMILAQLGYRVVAVTGKQDRHNWLKELGASEVAGRDLFAESRPRPLLSGRFAGGVDTVGGQILSTLVKMIGHRGCVACCGLTGGIELQMTVYPFILRGVTLAGIDSAMCPAPERKMIWSHLAGDWKPRHLRELARHVPLEKVDDEVATILRGEMAGRVVVDVSAD